jgi:predicted permease
MYRWLLHLYPASFRREYAAEMVAVFAHERRDVRTPLGLAALWMRAIADTCVNAAVVHGDILAQDLRFAVRSLLRAPAFALTAIAVVSLGIGATTAAFTVTDFVLVRPLPFPRADRLVKVWEKRPGFPQMEPSPANYRDWKAMVTSYEAFAAYRGLSVNLAGASQPLRIDGAVFTVDLLPMLGIEPVLGRVFNDEDDREGALATVLLSYGLWQREFGGDAAIIGKTVRLDDKPHTVIGVMPREFNFPRRAAQLWTAMRFSVNEFVDRNNNYLNVVARLRDGASLDAARTEMTLVAARLRAQYPVENANTDAALIGLRDEVSDQARLMLLALLGASACVLVIACANLANLLLARALDRRREIAVRAALGAGRERLLRQLLTESLLVAGLGGAIGIGLAAAAVPMLSLLVPSSLPVGATPALDLRVLAFTAAVTMLTGLAFGGVPLLQQRFSGDSDGLRDSARASGGRREHLRGALVVAEMAASVLLLVVCGLLLRALWKTQAIDPGFAAASTLTARTQLTMPKYEKTDTRIVFYDAVLSDVRRLPGVTSAAYTSFVPLGDMRGGVFPVGIGVPAPVDRRENNVAFLRFVTPDYFHTLGIAVRQGRDVSDADTNATRAVAVVSGSFADRFFPNQDPIGRRFNFAGVDREIVGIVGDVRMRGLTRTAEPQVYVPYRQVADRAWSWYAPKDLVVRSEGDPMLLVPSLRAIVQRADPSLPLSDIRTLEDVVGRETTPRVAQLRILGAFALIALLLAGVGLHGVLTWSVAARTVEIGIRVALGARRADIVSLIAIRALALTAMGIGAGIALAYGSGQVLQSLLAGVDPADTATIAAACALTLAMTMAVSIRPIVRAARVDPSAVVRLG